MNRQTSCILKIRSFSTLTLLSCGHTASTACFGTRGSKGFPLRTNDRLRSRWCPSLRSHMPLRQVCVPAPLHVLSALCDCGKDSFGNWKSRFAIVELACAATEQRDRVTTIHVCGFHQAYRRPSKRPPSSFSVESPTTKSLLGNSMKASQTCTCLMKTLRKTQIW